MSSAANGSLATRKESKKPKYSRFTQQELPACKPLLTPTVVISTFFIVGIIFIPLGAASLAASNSVVEVVQRYDQACLANATSNDDRSRILQQQDVTQVPACTLTITIPKKMDPTIYVYYQLENYYQNHRRYVKSRDDSQLRGNNVTDLSSCKPEDYLGGNKSLPIDPCGLIAWSLFNDTYAFSDSGSGSSISVDESDISWASDRDTKFGSQLPQNFNTDPALRGGAEVDPNRPLDQDEHLIVWMRTAALPTFRKLWGKINTTLDAGTNVVVNITNVYNTYPFNGKKSIVLSTTSWIGGKNNFLGIAYLVVGGLAVALALLFLLLHLINPRPLGDTSYLSWNRKALAAGGGN